jgi:Holliday junction resolvasome RuvABC endonuclease subunit
MSYFLGIDPDTHHCGCAIVDSHRNLHAAWVIEIPAKLTHMEAVIDMILASREGISPTDKYSAEIIRIAVEGQKLYLGHAYKGADLLKLAQVAGGLIAVCQQALPSAEILLPLPQQWKGTVPKAIHQTRLWQSVANQIEAEAILNSLKEQHLSHVLDAIGLALWSIQKKINITVV